MHNKDTNNHSDEIIEKISFLEVERFLENEMTEEETISFQKKISGNPEFEEYLENAARQKYSGSMDLLKSPIQNREKREVPENPYRSFMKTEVCKCH